MKVYSDDHVSKEQLERANAAAEEAVSVSKANLAAAEDGLGVSTENQKLLKVAIGLGIINLVIGAGTLSVLVRYVIG